MVQLILSLIASCVLFWAADFGQWREVVKATYTKKIDNISVYGVVNSFTTSPTDVSHKRLWNLKYVN
jgi:hypothetical protein